jgi:uncharacterized damage-inducible protein DinB
VTSAELLVDGFDRIQEVVHDAVDGLTKEQLAYRIDSQANSIAWLVWHLTRVQDDHLADLAGSDQVWTGGGWSDRFGLALDQLDTGYGHSSAEVDAVGASSVELLLGYHDAVHDRTVEYVAGLTDADLPRIVDEAWDPPVTLSVRLVSMISDDLQHAGQAAFIRGIAERA